MRGIIGTLTDITERKRLEREKMEAMQMGEQQQRKRAEEAEEVRRQQELFIGKWFCLISSGLSLPNYCKRYLILKIP